MWLEDRVCCGDEKDKGGGESEMTSRFLTWASLRIMLPFIKMGVNQGGNRLRGV